MFAILDQKYSCLLGISQESQILWRNAIIQTSGYLWCQGTPTCCCFSVYVILLSILFPKCENGRISIEIFVAVARYPIVQTDGSSASKNGESKHDLYEVFPRKTMIMIPISIAITTVRVLVVIVLELHPNPISVIVAGSAPSYIDANSKDLCLCKHPYCFSWLDSFNKLEERPLDEDTIR